MAANVQSMCNFWKNFDLQELQRELDTTATDLANRQDESDASRKKLVDQSREFKKNTPEDIRKIVAPLLKSFQGEVDSLSKRSKAAEAAFLSIYKRLIDLPDPVPVLEQALQTQKRAQRVSDLEIENKQLRETLDDYNNEFAEVKNQEVTIKQLKDKVREYEDKLQTTAEARAKEKERELQRQFAEKERQLQETQLAVARKLGEAEQKNVYLQTELENVQSELFEVKSKYDEATSAKSDEMDMVMADLERANERAASSEREVERLKQQLQTTTESVQTSADPMRTTPDLEHSMDILSKTSLQVELAAKEKEVAQLVEDVQKLQASLNKVRETSAVQVSKLEEEVAMKNKALALLEERLSSQADYEEIKRELGVMKSMEFAGAMEGGEEKNKGRSLEVLLLEKNKALQNENTQLKLSTASLSGSVSALPASSTSPHPSCNSSDDAPTNAFAQMVGEEMVQSYRSHSSSRSATPASSGVRSPTPTSFSTHRLPSTSTASVDVLDPRHFSMPPPSPFYSYSGLAGPFHPAFMPVNLVKSEMNSSGALDTSFVSKTVRELLAAHNIGQRLFAKHVLGLSQGTVSELLSKPKTWDKLTEKGRDSYRKMYNWASDKANIAALKALLPKKNTATSVANSLKEDSATEDRISSLLSEAQHVMHAKISAEQDKMASAVMSSMLQINMAHMAASPHLVMSSPSLLQQSKDHKDQSSHSGKTKRAVDKVSGSKQHSGGDVDEGECGENDEEMFYRIYRQELEKGREAAEAAGNSPLTVTYQQELERLSQHSDVQRLLQGVNLANLNRQQQNTVSGGDEVLDSMAEEAASQAYSAGPIDLSSKSRNPSTPTSSSSLSPTEAITADGNQSGSTLIPAKSPVNGHDDDGESPQQLAPNLQVGSSTGVSESMSPLQRMQNIANSLSSRSNTGTSGSKPLRSVLPPITQEEFDGHSSINTDELVKKVKEVLSQYSISQRLFGENVLGLSQGSVSDLLARPKPWNMLTQKGREPFIRMQLFLDDSEAVPKLLSSQYRVPTDKLMRNSTKSEGGESAPTPGAQAARCHGSAALPLSHPPPSSPSSSASPIPPPPSPPPDRALPLSLPPPPPPAPVAASGPQAADSVSGSGLGFCPEAGVPGNAQRQWGYFAFPSSMLEVLAMTSEMETLSLTARVKDVLQLNNLGQKLFGEAVLGLSQGSVSELLSKPKPWHMLSIKGREPFIKMQLWLSDSQNIEQLRLYQNQVKEQVKTLQKEAGDATTTVMEQKSLIAQLEDDLRNVNALSSMFRGDAEGEPGPPDTATEVVADIVRDVMPSGVVSDSSSSNKSAADSLLPIVQSQRERYRIRAQELEAQTLSQQQQLTLFQNEMDKLRSDNVKLYEKIRFLQSYPTKGGTDDLAVSRYSSQYEERLDPFTTFSRKERQRRYAELKPYDKITLSMGRVIMGNKIARTFAFFYTVLLHCLVFLVLYFLAHTESCKRDLAAECHKRFADHMYKVHGEENFHDAGSEGHLHGVPGGGH